MATEHLGLDLHITSTRARKLSAELDALTEAEDGACAAIREVAVLKFAHRDIDELRWAQSHLDDALQLIAKARTFLQEDLDQQRAADAQAGRPL